MSRNESSRPLTCGLCSDPENDQMVACDLCDKWYHYKCVHVGDSIADQSWSCPGCRNELLAASTPVGQPAKSIGSRRSGISSSSSIRAARAALELQQLEERKQLEMKRVVEEEERRKQEAELEKSRIEQLRLHREKEADLERKNLESQRRQLEEEQALAKKKLEEEKSRADLLRQLEDKYLAEKYRILNSQLEGASISPSSGSSVSLVRTSKSAKVLPNAKQRKPVNLPRGAEELRNQQVGLRMPKGIEEDRERLNQMRHEEDKRREESRKMLEQMGFAEKHNVLYAPRMQNAAEWAMNLPDEESAPGGMPTFPVPMSKPGQERYTGAYPKPKKTGKRRSRRACSYNPLRE
nr:caldesmon-like [Aedes albopictus]